MRLTARGSYAVRALVDLTNHGNSRPVSLREIAARGDISVSYLEQLFLKLRRTRIVRSVRGPGGGYLLARNPSEISVAEIIEAVEEKLEPIYCVDPAADRKCSRTDCCAAHLVWKELAGRIREFLSSVKLDELSRMTRGFVAPASGADQALSPNGDAPAARAAGLPSGEKP
jgi:Rrf2 family iron-sulfur cluster assembly transcriptional regulator